jgi:hypothetical protein
LTVAMEGNPDSMLAVSLSAHDMMQTVVAH